VDKEIKSGKQILDDFFNTLKEIPAVSEDVANVLLELYQNNKLTAKNLANALSKIREESANDKN
jgi:recombinational DNA repair protein RecR